MKPFLKSRMMLDLWTFFNRIEKKMNSLMNWVFSMKGSVSHKIPF